VAATTKSLSLKNKTQLGSIGSFAPMQEFWRGIFIVFVPALLALAFIFWRAAH
jgi:hypothetical protein